MFRQVPIGSYEITVDVSGFRELNAKIDVLAGTTYDYRASMTPLTDPAAGKSLLQVLDTDSGDERIYDRNILETFPADDVVSSVAETAAAPLIVDRISNGGLEAGESARIGGNGTSWRQAIISLGDLDVTDPVETGSTFLRANHLVFEALVLGTSTLPAHVAGPGPLLTLVPRALNRWEGAITAGGISRALQSTNRNNGAPSITRFDKHRDMAAEVGGTIARRVQALVASQSAGSTQVERDDATVLSTSAAALFADVNIAVDRNDRLRVSPSLNRSFSPIGARLLDRNRQRRAAFTAVQSSWEHWMSNGGAFSISGDFQTTRIAATSRAVAISDGGVIERLRDGPVPSLFASLPGRRQRWNGRADIEPSVKAGHLFTAGLSTERNLAEGDAAVHPPVAELVAGLPARVWEFSSGNTHWASTELGAYVADEIDLPLRIRTYAGVRIDVVRASARDARNRIAWNSLTPRVHARWAIDDAGHFFVSGGYARYAHHLPLEYLAFGDSAAANVRSYRWLDPNDDEQFTQDERGPLISAAGACCGLLALNTIDPLLRAPYTNELVGAVAARMKGWSVRIAGVDRQEHRLVAAQNIGVTARDYTVRYIPDPGGNLLDRRDDDLLPVYDRNPASFGNDRYVLTNPSGHDAEYRGLEVTVDREMVRGFRTRFDGALYAGQARGSNRGFGPVENDSGTVGEIFTDPNADTFARGHQFFDRAYVMKWWAAYAAPQDWLISAVARYQDGQPFSRVVVVPDLNQGPEAIQAYRRGRTRFTFSFTLDTHIERSFGFGRIRTTGIVEIFNLLNTRNEVEEDIVTGPTFRQTTAVQPPRAARMALRLRF